MAAFVAATTTTTTMTMPPSIRPKVGPLLLLSYMTKPPARIFNLTVRVPRQAANIPQHYPAHRPFIRQYSATAAKSADMSSNQQPRLTADSDPEALETFLSPLLVGNGGRWVLTMDGQALEREFKFKTFAKTWVSRSQFLLGYLSKN